MGRNVGGPALGAAGVDHAGVGRLEAHGDRLPHGCLKLGQQRRLLQREVRFLERVSGDVEDAAVGGARCVPGAVGRCVANVWADARRPVGQSGPVH